MTVNRTTLLDLPLPVTGTESGTWGDTTNNGLTQYLDIAIAGTLVLSTDADVTLTSTEGDSSATNIGATTAQYAILRWTATGSTTRNITALAQSKTYVVINATGGTQSIVLRGAGPTTGVTIISGEKAHCVWNGSDFVKVSSSAAAGGSNTQVQYNSSGVLAGSSNMTFDGTSLTLGGNPTLSAGTANGVLYLNGSKVATSGSALTFDGTTQNSPIYQATSGAPGFSISNQATGAARSQYVNTGGTFYFGLDSSAAGLSTAYAVNYWYTGNYPHVWAVNNTEQMRLTSTGLGIGTSSPVAKLDVTGDIKSTVSVNVTLGGSDTAFAGPWQGVSNAGNNITWATQLSASNNLDWWYYNAGATSKRMTLDSSGNLGLGVTPTSWISNAKALQISAFFSAWQQSNGAVNLGFGVYEGGLNTFNYSTTGDAASRYSQYLGTHAWYTAPSGTAGNAITFTQAMTLDASGNLQIGSISNAYKLGVSGDIYIQPPTGTTNALLRLNNTGGDAYVGLDSNSGGLGGAYTLNLWHGGNYPIVFATNNTERARITSGGEVYIAGTTDQGAYNLQVNGTGVWGAGAYVNGSDERLKDNIQTLNDGLAVVSQLRPVTFQYKPEHSKDQSVQPGFIAQELQQAMAGKNYVDGVVQSGPEYLNVAYQNLIPILTKAIQEQQALITSLTARVALLEGN